MKFATECFKSEFYIFQTRPVDTSNEDGWWMTIDADDLSKREDQFRIDIKGSNGNIYSNLCSS